MIGNHNINKTFGDDSIGINFKYKKHRLIK